MDKFLVDLDSVLDKLEAEDADRCATDELDDDEPCNLIGSSVYRNSEKDKIKQSFGGGGEGGGVSSGGSGAFSNFQQSTQYKHHHPQESMFVKSNDDEKVTGKSIVSTGDGIGGGSCSSNINNINSRSELDSFLSSSQPLLNEKLLVNDGSSSFGNKSSVITQIGKIEKIHSEKSSVTTEDPVKPNLTDDCEDELDISSTIKSGIEGGIGGGGSSNNFANDDAKGELTNVGNLDGKNVDLSINQEEKLLQSSTSSHQDDHIQQSVNLEQTNHNTINSIRSGSIVNQDAEVKRGGEDTTEYSGLVKNESSSTSTTSTITKQLEIKPIGEQVTTSDNYGDLLLSHLQPLPSSSPTSSNVLSKSNFTLENSSKGEEQIINSKLAEEVEESDEEMTEEEVKALEKELESELRRLNTHSEIETLEDIIESESKATINISTETIVSKSSVSSSTTFITTTTTTTSSSSSSSYSPSSLSPSTSSSSLTLSKPIETSIASGSSLLINNQPSESHQSSSSSFNESTINGNQATMVNKENGEEEISSNISETHGNNSLTIKPVRPATLPLSNNAQSNQPGHTPMHGEVEQLIPVSPTIPIEESETEQNETQTGIAISSSSSSQFSSIITPNNQIERDIVPENVQVSMSSIGYFKPFWIPDDDAPQCMICDSKFTVMKRRHHCRACGKVLCAQCSRFKAPLAYLSYEKARVCEQCLPLLTEGGNISGQDNLFNDSGYYQAGQHPLGAEGLPTPSAPPPHHLLTASSSSTTTTTTTTTTSSLVTGATAQSSSAIQPVSVLRRPSKPRTGEPKQVIFSDGIRPGNDLKDDQVTSMSHRRHAKKVKSPPIEKNSPGFSSASSSSKSRLSKRIVIQDSNGQLPPILNASSLHSDPTFDNLITLLEKEDEPPVTFSLTKNLMALVKLVKLDCCTNEHCWSFTSQNLSIVGQDEIIVVVEKISGENVIPRDIFRLFAYIYDSASKGYPFSELSHVLYPDGFFGLKDFPSFVFIRPTFQCLNKLPLPPAPFLIGILIHRFEVPWAKLFPLRLILRLGSKYRCYPCPIVSYRSRRPSYFEIGHTVMDILADFRNFQYTLPVIPGLTIHTEAKRTTVTFPKNRYDKVMKALGSSNEYVLSFGGTFSLKADSHLTCIQNDDGQYHTQTIKLIDDETRELAKTGASFIVFSGALKSSTGLMAKMSIVEDGLLVQVTANTLNSLKSSLKDMNDFIIECGKKDAPTNEESVSLIWGEDDKQFNLGVLSCIDGLSLEGINSIRMFSGTDFEGEKYLIRWVELFLIQNTELPRSSDGYDAGRAAEIIAQSFCPALVPCLESLIESQITKIGLRVTLDPDKIGYDVGSNGSPLPSNYVNRLDAALIPIIMGNIAPNMEVRLVIELIFYILVK